MRYFVGTSQASSPDGATSFGSARAYVAKRTGSIAKGIIVEEIAQDGMSSTTTLTRRGDSSVFDATDADRTFSGTVTYSGDPFTAGEWEYALTLADGSKLTGRGSLSASGLGATKLVTSPDGQPKARIVDDLKVSTDVDYAAARAKLAPATPSAAPARPKFILQRGLMETPKGLSTPAPK